ncbi:MAG TPA: hypothetical protein DDW27_16180 [Bacteroidales bacterium]|nr:hypothetical protein [Bacteroidales bacterium]
MAHVITDGVHLNISMNIIDPNTLEVKKRVPVFTGGSWKNRVNLNTKPSLACDKSDRLWISWENDLDWCHNFKYPVCIVYTVDLVIITIFM